MNFFILLFDSLLIPCLVSRAWFQRIQAFKTNCLRKLFHIFYLQQKTIDWDLVNRFLGKNSAVTLLPECMNGWMNEWMNEWMQEVSVLTCTPSLSRRIYFPSCCTSKIFRSPVALLVKDSFMSIDTLMTLVGTVCMCLLPSKHRVPTLLLMNRELLLEASVCHNLRNPRSLL